MSKERLSKLQKWILVEAYKRGRRNLTRFPPDFNEDFIIKSGLGDRLNQYWIGTADVHREYFEQEKADPVKAVILCRSIAKLSERDYFEMKVRRQDFGQCAGDIQVVLSEEGINKAKSIMAEQK